MTEFTTLREELAEMGLYVPTEYADAIVCRPCSDRRLMVNTNGEFWSWTGSCPTLFGWAGTYEDSRGNRHQANHGYALCVRQDGRGLCIKMQN